MPREKSQPVKTEEEVESPYENDVSVEIGVDGSIIASTGESDEEPILVAPSIVAHVKGDMLVLTRLDAEKLHAALTVALDIQSDVEEDPDEEPEEE